MNKYQKLQTSIEFSRRQMTPFRERRHRFVRQYLGQHWGRGGTVNEKMPMNMLALAVQTFTRSLAARNPAVNVHAKKRAYVALAKKLEITVNQIIKEIDLRSALATAVFDSVFCIGAIKVGITDGNEHELNGELHDAGIPFADAIDPDDLLIDMNARRMETMQYCGNRYLLPLEQVKDSKLFGKKADDLVAATHLSHNEYGDPRIQTLVNEDSSSSQYSHAYDLVELWDVWLPYERLMVTFAADATGNINCDRVLRESKWDGPEMGPYHILGLGDMSGTIMPVPPITNLIDMNDAINRSFRKLFRQLERQKTLTVVAGGADEDGNRIQQADDGDVIRVDRPEATREVRFGGPDNISLMFTTQMRELFSYISGNLDAMAGLSSTASTLGQEELIKASSSDKIMDMQARMLAFTKNVVRDLAGWIFYDPITTFDVNIPITPEENLETSWSPEDREEGDFLQLELDIAPVSMQDASPSQRLQTITNTATNIMIPLSPVLQQQGYQFDAVALTRHISELTNTPELMELISPADTPPDEVGSMENGERPEQQAPEMPQPQQPRQPRVYEPTGGTRAARDTVMAQAMAGMSPTPQQQDMMGRGGM